jgi:hypothetical protein
MKVNMSSDLPIIAEIECTVGIYKSSYKLLDYDSYLVVSVPDVVWRNNTGSLSYRKFKVTNKETIDVLREMFRRKLSVLVLNDVYVSLMDILNELTELKLN